MDRTRNALNGPSPEELVPALTIVDTDLFDSLHAPSHRHEQAAPLHAIPIGTDRILLRSADSISARLEERLHKHWAKTLGLEPEEQKSLIADPEFGYLTPYLDFDRTIRTLGGTLRISFDPQNRFDAVVLTSPDLRDQTASLAGSIIPAETLEALSKTQIVEALVLDPDRLPKDLESLSTERRHRETLRAMRDEVLPTLVSGILGELGVPQRRGSRGFDLLCEPHSLANKMTPTEDVQVKQMCWDSPIFNKQSLTGRKQFWKLVTILGSENSLGTSNKALLIQDSASDEQVAELVSDLVSAGAKREQIIVLDKERLGLAGLELIEIGAKRANGQHKGVAIQVDLQKFLRFSWAELVASMSAEIFRKIDPKTVTALTKSREYQLPHSRQSLEEPFEMALLRANGCLEIVEYCRRR